jgi:hypothetical protein
MLHCSYRRNVKPKMSVKSSIQALLSDPYSEGNWRSISACNKVEWTVMSSYGVWPCGSIHPVVDRTIWSMLPYGSGKIMGSWGLPCGISDHILWPMSESTDVREWPVSEIDRCQRVTGVREWPSQGSDRCQRVTNVRGNGLTGSLQTRPPPHFANLLQCNVGRSVSRLGLHQGAKLDRKDCMNCDLLELSHPLYSFITTIIDEQSTNQSNYILHNNNSPCVNQMRYSEVPVGISHADRAADQILWHEDLHPALCVASKARPELSFRSANVLDGAINLDGLRAWSSLLSQ